MTTGRINQVTPCSGVWFFGNTAVALGQNRPALSPTLPEQRWHSTNEHLLGHSSCFLTPINLSPLQLSGTILMPPQYNGIDYAVAVASQFGRVFTSTLVNMHRLLPMLAEQIWYNFPPLFYHAIMLHAICSDLSPHITFVRPSSSS